MSAVFFFLMGWPFQCVLSPCVCLSCVCFGQWAKLCRGLLKDIWGRGQAQLTPSLTRIRTIVLKKENEIC